MPAIRDPKVFQLGAAFASAILVGIYSCIILVTLWRPVGAGRPLAIGWIIIAIYCLTLCRVAAGYRTLGRTLFTTSGKREMLDSTEYVLLGLRHGFSFAATWLSDGLFCWKLYVISSRSIRIVLLPAGLMVLNAISFTTIVVIDFLLAWRPNDRLAAINFQLFVAVQCVILVNTCYITVFIASLLWSVGRAVNKMSPLEKSKRNGYSTAICALVQTGVIHSATRVVTIVIALAVDPTMLSAAGGITLTINAISITLLFLQLNMFQKQTRDHEASPLTTGATFDFVHPEASSSSACGEWSRPSVTRQRRASVPMTVCQARGPATDTQASVSTTRSFSTNSMISHCMTTALQQPYSPIQSTRYNGAEALLVLRRSLDSDQPARGSLVRD
ncbi:hypothetical protein FRB94_010707 [Tulasnella sp. JGI-2019a]|nr:hypothetical protein FRB93_003187 [Tulasnella sp. JGI-2019a]KAG8993551.1 hypothetical protein FRB94_010707 [Tulasnella sp. JGI-2019a]